VERVPLARLRALRRDDARAPDRRRAQRLRSGEGRPGRAALRRRRTRRAAARERRGRGGPRQRRPALDHPHLNRAAAARALAVCALLACAAALGWLAHGPHALPFTGTGSFAAGADYANVDAFDVASTRYGTWAGDDAKTGAGASEVFAATPLVVARVAGGTSRPDEVIALRRLDDGETLRLAGGADAGEHYLRLMELLPPAWWGKPVRFTVTDSGGRARGWLGIAGAGTPTVAEILGYLAWPWILLDALLLGVPASVVGGALARRCRIAGEAGTYCAALLVLGAAAEGAFFAARFTPLAGAAGAVLEGALLAGAAAVLLRDRAAREAARRPAAWTALAVATAAAVGYALILSAAAPLDQAPLAKASLSWMPLPADNVLPRLLAWQAETHAPPRPFGGDWLSSDRPPLQAGFAIIADAVERFAEPDDRYEALASWLQALAFGGLFALARAAGATVRRALAASALCFPVGFFLLNTVFTWPKLLAAAYGLVALAVAWRGGASRVRYALAGAACAFAMLAHGGVAFTLPAIAGAALLRDRGRAVVPFAIAAGVFVLISAPWSAYQRFYDPPGDRLVKWHLAGQVAPDPDEPVLRVLVRAYTAHPAGELARQRFDNVKSVARLQLGRVGEFFFVATALGAFVVPVLLALVPWPRERGVTALAAITLASLLFWCATKWSGAVIHEGSYLTMALLFLAGALTATRLRATAWLLAAVQTLAFTIVWLLGVVVWVPLLCALALVLGLAGALAVAIGAPLPQLAARK
jgi:hypothetical protein